MHRGERSQRNNEDRRIDQHQKEYSRSTEEGGTKGKIKKEHRRYNIKSKNAEDVRNRKEQSENEGRERKKRTYKEENNIKTTSVDS